MDENDKLIALFSTRVRQLLLLVEKLRKENKALSDEVALRDKSLEEMGYELAQARNDYNSLMMAKMIEITDGDNTIYLYEVKKNCDNKITVFFQKHILF